MGNLPQGLLAQEKMVNMAIIDSDMMVRFFMIFPFFV
tara:strand:+ start:413 stop:523 length:111 start_codon:yes stop_codon:yes gene_type:complete